MSDPTAIPAPFLWRRLHSLTGLFFVLYLFEHLLINSQAALWIGEDGTGFVEAVNAIHRIPFLPFIEVGLLGVPIALHTFLGVRYLFTAQQNSSSTDGSKPSLPNYSRNHAYTWQRYTSWILLFGLIFHVIHMRFVEYPASTKEGSEHLYMIRAQEDLGLRALSKRLGVEILESNQITESSPWFSALQNKPLGQGEVIAIAPSFGTADLLVVRETFKMPIMLAIYTLFVGAACFHGFNGLWTFMISWGINLTQPSQKYMLVFSHFLMLLVAFFGLAAIWGTYWINLKQ
ncbi:MAG: succinate dehydrogenase [Parachlamydiaceae bacterium]|nr:succinate dehydrogenase [Parachlamydiaceae bacterium]